MYKSKKKWKYNISTYSDFTKLIVLLRYYIILKITVGNSAVSRTLVFMRKHASSNPDGGVYVWLTYMFERCCGARVGTNLSSTRNISNNQ